MSTLTISNNTSLEGVSLEGINLLKVFVADVEATIELLVTKNESKIFAEKALSYLLHLDLRYNARDTHKKIVQEG